MRNTHSATRLSVWVAFLLTIAGLSPSAQASVLAPGHIVPPGAFFPGGTLLASKSATITTIAFSTSFTQWVYRDPNNTWCSTCLDFVCQFTTMGPAVNNRFEMSSFAGFQTDVGTDAIGITDPISIDRSTDGALIGFNYSPGIEPGVTTPWLVIETDALAYSLGCVNALGPVSDLDRFVGSAAAYEPGV